MCLIRGGLATHRTAGAQAPAVPAVSDCSEATASTTAIATAAARLDCTALAAVDAAAAQLVESGYTPGLAVAVKRGEQLAIGRHATTRAARFCDDM